MMFDNYHHTFSVVSNAVGSMLIAYVLYKTVRWSLYFFVTYMLARVLPLSADLKKAGSWSVVTGCTDGIGKAYAEQLAAKGLNIVLISRTLSKLTDLAKEIESKYNVKTLVIAANFTDADIYDDIKLRLAQLDIGVLVNNVGMSVDYPEYFGEIEQPDFVKNMINANSMSVAKMTEIVLPGMTKKSSGYIINIASGAGNHTFPFISLYSSTKRFILHFTKCMNLEYMQKGITFQCLTPAFVATKMSRCEKPSTFIPSPTTYVKDALRTVGLQNYTTGHWAHEIQDAVLSILPHFFWTKFWLHARNVGRSKVAAGEPRDKVFFWF